MTPAVAAIVAGGVVLALAVGLTATFDVRSFVTLVAIIGVGALALAIARRAGGGTVAPTRCPSCDGLLSAHASSCKHCGRRV